MHGRLWHKLHLDGGVLCGSDNPAHSTADPLKVNCPECRQKMAGLTVGDDAVRALAELRRRIKDKADEYDRYGGLETVKQTVPLIKAIARDLRRLLEE